MSSTGTQLECPLCGSVIFYKRDHNSGCPNWGLLPEDWT